MKGFWLQLLVVLGLVLAGLVLWLKIPREPSVDGRTLTEWLQARRYPPDDSSEVSNAVCKIGPQAVPFLLAKLHAKSPAWMLKLRRTRLGERLPYHWLDPALQKHEEAEFGICCLGTQAVSAIPELSRMFFDTNGHGPGGFTLGRIGLEARPVLLSALTNASALIRLNGVIGLMATREMALASETNVRPLIHQPDLQLATATVFHSMMRLPGARGLTVAIEALHDSRPPIQHIGLIGLQLFVKTNRTSALPAIIPLLESPDPMVRKTATNLFQELSSPAELHQGEATGDR